MENIRVKQELDKSNNTEDLNYIYDGGGYNLKDKENIEIGEVSVKVEFSENMENSEDDFRSTNELPLQESTKDYKNKSDISNIRITEKNIPSYLNCDICKQRRFTNYELMTHRFEHSLDTYYTCLICFKTYPSRNFLISHIVGHSQAKHIYRPTNSNTKSAYTCEICSKCFSCPSNFNKHKRTHITEKRYKCDVCKRQYTQKSYLTIHKREHTGEKPFKCVVCNKEYTSNNMLTQHKKTHHNSINGTRKLFECDLCKIRFTFENSMKRHKLMSHSNVEFVKCHICDKKFKRSSDLKLHIRLHIGEKPFECKICQERFAVKSQMYEHKRTHSD